AGFIVFGGELNTVRQGISELQKEADGCLIIASDLEQGLGQHIEGGTIFPPAMAVAKAIKEAPKSTVHSQKLKLLRRVFKAIAIEARYAGINTIFAPVLDINTNPKNPIISTRAFGEDPESVSFFGCEMIKTFQSHGITACGKHFPGHGDTETDSHIKLPKIKKDLKTLSRTEFAPFRNAVKAGVKMIMLGHLNVPALDLSGIPASLSKKAVSYLRKNLGFKGIIITDAMNMGGIGRYSEEEASLMALNAGVDILLHPTDPDKVVSYLGRKVLGVRCQVSGTQLWRKKKAALSITDFERNRRLAEKITKMAIKIDGQLNPLRNPLLIIISDDTNEKGKTLYAELKSRYRSLKYLHFKHGEDLKLGGVLRGRELIVAVFSGIRAWKGGPSPWLLKCIRDLKEKAEIFISFGSPYLIDRVGNDTARIYAYWASEAAQKTVAEILFNFNKVR
ncbi:MAG: glycoside hydrolase family 3 N-terminal domain-containing protein, partial [Nitrospirota bacterium]|nr:glycoside hydrolase family 3 N-terminal domain-containing protein [Nitrospirota bacterium]